ncbi:MAG TPA: hypothetical protein VGE97_04115 [Nitrososphaera sp.]
MKARSGKYVSGFKEEKVAQVSLTDVTFKQYFPQLASTPSAPFYFQSVKDRPSDAEITADGKTEVRLVNTDNVVGPYNVLGMWNNSPYCYYFNNYLDGPHSDQETWILEKRGEVGVAERDKLKLRFGDRVTITNKNEQSGVIKLSRLIESYSNPNPDYLTMQNMPGEGVDYWTIEPYEEPERHGFLAGLGTVKKFQAVGEKSEGAPQTTLTIPEGYKILGGGARVNWSEPGNLLTASYPLNERTWIAASKAHGTKSDAYIDVWAIAIYDPNNQLDVKIFPEDSATSHWPSATATVGKGYVLTGGGAQAKWKVQGSLLTASYPIPLLRDQMSTQWVA